MEEARAQDRSSVMNTELTVLSVRNLHNVNSLLPNPCLHEYKPELHEQHNG
jgi:hypothetical protein